MIWYDGYDSCRDLMEKMEKKVQREHQDLLWVFQWIIYAKFMAIYIFCIFWLVDFLAISGNTSEWYSIKRGSLQNTVGFIVFLFRE